MQNAVKAAESWSEETGKLRLRNSRSGNEGLRSRLVLAHRSGDTTSCPCEDRFLMMATEMAELAEGTG